MKSNRRSFLGALLAGVLAPKVLPALPKAVVSPGVVTIPANTLQAGKSLGFMASGYVGAWDFAPEAHPNCRCVAVPIEPLTQRQIVERRIALSRRARFASRFSEATR